MVNGFMFVNFRLYKQWNLVAGLDVNSHSFKLEDRFTFDGDQSGSYSYKWIASPRIEFNYNVPRKIFVYGSISHGFSIPSIEESLLPSGEINPGLKPEMGWMTEVGTRIETFYSKWFIQAAVYHIDLKDLLVTKRLTEDTFTGINAGQTKHSGFEISSFYDIFNHYSRFPGLLSNTVTYTISANHFAEFTDNGMDYKGNQLPGIPKHMLNIRFDWYPLETFKIEAGIQKIGQQWMNDRNTEAYNGYWLANLSCSYRWELKRVGTLSFYSGIDNLFNKQYASMILVNAVGFGGAEPRYYYPGLPRNSQIGIRYKF